MWIKKSLKTAGTNYRAEDVGTYYDDTPIQAYGEVGPVPFNAAPGEIWGAR